MPDVRITQAELEALWGLPWLAQLIYLRVLRPRMDYETGVVGGPAQRISYRAIVEQTEVHPEHTASHRHEQASRQQINRALRKLERVGLAQRQSNARHPEHLVFRLSLAVTGSIRPQEPRHANDTGPRHTESRATQGFPGGPRHTENGEPRHSSGSPDPVGGEGVDVGGDSALEAQSAHPLGSESEEQRIAAYRGDYGSGGAARREGRRPAIGERDLVERSTREWLERKQRKAEGT